MPAKSHPFTNSVWMRPERTRGDQPTLSRQQIVRAAIELLDAEGTDGLSMRRLGTKLGSGATSAYWHVANKDELLELAVDEVMAEVYVPEPGDASWRIAASTCASGLRAMLLRHPWVIGQLGVRPNIGPNAMRISDRAVAVLAAAGFGGMDLAYVSSLLFSHAIGSAMTVSAITTRTRQAGVSAKDLYEELRPHVQRIAADHPNYGKWLEESGEQQMEPERQWDEGFMFGLERLLDGLELWLGKQKP